MRNDPQFMNRWQASIFQCTVRHTLHHLLLRDHITQTPLPIALSGVQGGGGDQRIWCMTLVVDEKYPTTAPTIKFTTKINADFVDARGNVRGVPCGCLHAAIVTSNALHWLRCLAQ